MTPIDLETLHRPTREDQYSLRQLGTDERAVLKIRFALPYDKRAYRGWYWAEILTVAIRRTEYLNSILPCEESIRAIAYLTDARDGLSNTSDVRVIYTSIPGHIYQVLDTTGLPETDPLQFVCRNSGAVQRSFEWVGIQTQELLRALIHSFGRHRFQWQRADLCRKALWEYEARAYRRKRQEHNRAEGNHIPSVFPYKWENIETWDIGEDGHIPFLESEILYHANYGVCDAEPIPGVDPFTMGSDPVYQKAEKGLHSGKRL